MRCIYFEGKTCYANPAMPVLVAKYQPSEEDTKAYCETRNFVTCPRAIATIEHFKAMSHK